MDDRNGLMTIESGDEFRKLLTKHQRVMEKPHRPMSAKEAEAIPHHPN